MAVIFIDDLQWADASSLRLLFHLARNLEERAMLVLGAYRPVQALETGPKAERRLEVELRIAECQQKSGVYAEAAKTYATLQSAMRSYYGRGARGILLRVGAQLWHRLLNEAPLTVKPRITFARGLATKENPKPVLDLLAKLFSTKSGDLTVHTLDLDLLLVDHPSPAASGQQDNEPICWVTMGLMREALYCIRCGS